MMNKKLMLRQWGMRHGDLLVENKTEVYVNERTLCKHHIVWLQDRLLECVGHEDRFLRQPIFNDVTAEISGQKYDDAMLEMDILILGASAVQP